MTLIPKTRCEFEMGEKLSKIKAIRGLTPKKDVKLQFGGNFNAVSVLFSLTHLVACFKEFSRCQVQSH